MFTGIVEEMGHIRHAKPSDAGYILVIECCEVLQGTRLGDSIAVNGVCLTVTELAEDSFTCTLAPETRQRTNLDIQAVGAEVNLERALTPSTRMGGHFVQGHVDAMGEIEEKSPDADALWITVHVPESLAPYIVKKGFICIDGTSLTVVDVGPDWFNVTLISYTQAHITLPKKSVGDKVNIEVDILGKYIERQLALAER